MFFDNGDTEWEVRIHGRNTDEFWHKVQNYINTLPVLDD